MLVHYSSFAKRIKYIKMLNLTLIYDYIRIALSRKVLRLNNVASGTF